MPTKTEPAMTKEEYEAVLRRLGLAFKDLPDDEARMEALETLVGIMKLRVPEERGLLKEWMEQAHGTLKGARMIWRTGA